MVAGPSAYRACSGAGQPSISACSSALRSGVQARRGGGVDAGRVLAHDAAVGADQAVTAGGAAGALHRLGDGVHGVVVARAAEERQSPGEGEAARIGGVEAEPVADVEHRRGEAAVQVDRGQVVRADAGHGEGMAHRHGRGRARGQVGAVEQVPFAQVGVAVQEHPPVGGDAQTARRGHRHQQHGGALVDLLPRHDVAGVRVGDGPVRLGGRDQLVRAALDRRGGVRAGRRDPGERGEQRAHGGRVLLAALPEAAAPRVVDQRVLAGRAGQPVRGLVPGHHPGQPVPAVLQAALGVLGEVGPVLRPGEVLDGGDGLRAEDQRHLAAAPRDDRGELVDQVLRGLPAADLKDGAGRGRADPAGHGPGVVIRTAQRCPRPRMGILELADADGHLDRRRDRGGLGPGVGQRAGGRVGGQVDRRAPEVAGLAEALGGLPDPHDDGRARVEGGGVHGRAGIGGRLAHSLASSLARSRIRCSQSATIWRVISPAGLICSKEPTTWPT